MFACINCEEKHKSIGQDCQCGCSLYYPAKSWADMTVSEKWKIRRVYNITPYNQDIEFKELKELIN